MKLYVIRASHNCRRVLATAAHLGLEPEVIEPNMPAGELKQPAYLAVNPNGKVPALEDGDFKLWEGNAIMQYLAEQKPGNSLWPADTKARAKITSWQLWDGCHLSRGTSGLTFEKLFKPMFLQQQPDPAAVEQALKTFHQFAPVLNAQLEGNSYLVGNDLTLADFSVGASFSYAQPTELPVGDYPHIQAWLGRLNELEAWKQTAPQP